MTTRRQQQDQLLVLLLLMAFFFAILIAQGHGTQTELTDFDIGVGQIGVNHGVGVKSWFRAGKFTNLGVNLHQNRTMVAVTGLG